MFSELEKVVLGYSDRVAVISTVQPTNYLAQLTGNKHQPDTTCLNWTLGALHHASIQTVDRLQIEYSVKPGSTIVSLVPNGVGYPLMLWSSMMGKYTYCPLDPNLLVKSNAEELKELLDQMQADAIVVMDEKAAVAVNAQLTYTPKVKVIAGDDQCSSWNDAKSDDIHRTSLILFTSGTSSGVPKGCPRPVAAWPLDMTLQYMEIETSLTDKPMRSSLHTQNFLAIAPVYAWATWSKAGAIVIQDGFKPSAMLDAIRNHKISHILMLPTMVAALRKQPNYEQIDKSSIRGVMLAGDIITQDAYNVAVKAFPDAEVFNVLGMTECTTFFNWPLAGKVGARDTSLHDGILPVGKVNPGTRLRMVGKDNRPVKIGEKGAMHVQQRGCVRRYLNDEKPEDFYTDEQGSWFKTGDVGLVNDKGWIWVLRRSKDIIMRAGIPISPAL